MTRVRYFVHVDEADRLLCWFEMKGDDLYWGSAKPNAVDLEPIPFKGGSISLTVPSVLKVVEGKQLKGSYHASGQTHIKVGAQYSGNPQWLPTKHEIQKPLMFAALLTMPASTYRPYNRKLTRGQAFAKVLKVSKANAGKRILLEFFLAPAGTFEAPPSLVTLKDGVLPPAPQTQSLNSNLILAVRDYTTEGDLNLWQPSLEVWFSFQP